MSAADDFDRTLLAHGLPFESRDADGARLCRHHGRRIRSRGAPCADCVIAGRGVGAPEVEA